MTYKYFSGDWLSDCLILESYIQDLKFWTGTKRKKLCGIGESMLYGITYCGYLKTDKDGNKILKPRAPPPHGNYFLTKARQEYPELELIFKEFGLIHFPEFPFLNIQINKNYPVPRHKDKLNVGDSILLGLGDYEGGELIIESPGGDRILPTRYRKIKFNGFHHFHYPKPWIGERFVLIFFNGGLKQQANQ